MGFWETHANPASLFLVPITPSCFARHARNHLGIATLGRGAPPIPPAQALAMTAVEIVMEV
jgi:hypothetical protein